MEPRRRIALELPVPAEINDAPPSSPEGVFYDAGRRESWGQFLMVAPRGWSGILADPLFPWAGEPVVSIEAARATAIGAGAANTKAMLESGPTGAAWTIDVLNRSGGEYNDWFLPSRDELKLLFLSAATNGGFGTDPYWTSSELEGKRAWSQHLIAGGQAAMSKHAALHVRPIRAF
jgi:hypothetical protein